MTPSPPPNLLANEQKKYDIEPKSSVTEEDEYIRTLYRRYPKIPLWLNQWKNLLTFADVRSSSTTFPETSECSFQANRSSSPGSLAQHKLLIADIYLDEGKSLNAFQTQEFWKAVQTAVEFHEPYSTPKKVAETAKICFNQRHLLICANGIGLGGNIRLSHVKSLLKEKGVEVRKALLHIAPLPQQQAAIFVADKKLKREQIDSLPTSKVIMYLRHLNLPIRNTKAKRYRVLHEYFDKKPAGYEVEM
jgi:hypothetical protein